MKNDTIVVKHSYEAPIAAVWQAITDPSQMKQWYFDMPEFRAEVGCEFSFISVSADLTKHLLCKVTEVIPGRKISYIWKYAGYEGESLVTFDLSELSGRTTLTITHTGISALPKKMHEHGIGFQAGWTQLTDISLRAFLEKSVSTNINQ